MGMKLEEELFKLGFERHIKTALFKKAPKGLAHALTEGAGYHGLEAAGLGTLALPSVAHLAGHDMEEGTKSKLEIAGLGALAVPSGIKLYKHFRGK
jgi:hypothetical protein